MSPVLRICLAAFAMDLALYLMLTGVPYRALALGAGSLALGLLPAAYSLPYAGTAALAGRLTEGADRLRVARRLLPVTALAMLALTRAEHLAWVYVAPAVAGVTLAFYWPSLMGTLADLSEPRRLTRHLGWFNISWSLGKSFGFLVGGALLAAAGFASLFGAAAGAVVGVFVLLLGLPRGTRSAPERGAPAETVALPPNQGALLGSAWIANFATFGATAALNFHYPAWLERHGLPETVFGAFLGVVFLSTTAAFLFLERRPGWRDRAAPLLLAPVPSVAALLLLPHLLTPWAILAAAPWIGFGLGQAYFASLYYSVRDPVRRGRNAGIHEACLHLGAVALPLLGGIVGAATGRLEAPFWVAAAAGGVGWVGEMTLLLRPARRG
jgi:MFS family permease